MSNLNKKEDFLFLKATRSLLKELYSLKTYSYSELQAKTMMGYTHVLKVCRTLVKKKLIKIEIKSRRHDVTITPKGTELVDLYKRIEAMQK